MIFLFRLGESQSLYHVLQSYEMLLRMQFDDCHMIHLFYRKAPDAALY